MKVWIVMQHIYYDDSVVMDVFKNPIEAFKAVYKFNKGSRYEHYNEFDYEEWDVK